MCKIRDSIVIRAHGELNSQHKTKHRKKTIRTHWIILEEKSLCQFIHNKRNVNTHTRYSFFLFIFCFSTANRVFFTAILCSCSCYLHFFWNIYEKKNISSTLNVSKNDYLSFFLFSLAKVATALRMVTN